MIVLSLCDYTGNMVEPWLDSGHECWIVDTQHKSGIHKDGLLVRVGADIRTWLPPRTDYKIVFAFPPCTDLAVSGARWFKDKGLEGLAPAIELVARCRDIAEWSDAPWMIENPIGTLSTYWRQPDFKFDPCDYGDPWTKRTCLWAGGGFVMPPKEPVPVTDEKYILTTTRWNPIERSATPRGFARAVYEANEAGQ